MILQEALRNILLTAALPPLGLFIIFYVTEPINDKWWHRRWSKAWLATPLGPVWLGQKVALFLIFTSVCVFFWVGEYPGRRVITDLLYAVLVGLFWAHFIFLVRVQSRKELIPPPRLNRRHTDPGYVGHPHERNPPHDSQ